MSARLSPHRLAKLANALGVCTPVPISTQSPQPTISTTTTLLLHVIPPSHLLDCPGYHIHPRRGSLVPLHSTLHAQLAAIAREYALPSTVGLVLYLITDDDRPRLSDHIWKLLWSRVVSAERSSSPSPSPSLRPLTCSPSPSKSDTTPDPDPRATALRLPGLTSPSLLPILAKLEFDIDKRKATWFDPWFNSRKNKRLPTTPQQFHILKNFPVPLNTPINLNDHDEDEEDLDQDATATFPLQRGPSLTNAISTKEDQVLEMLDNMSKRSLSRSSSRPDSTSTHASLPPTDHDPSYLAYTEPLPLQLAQGGKREFAVFDDFELQFDPTLDIDDNDPNDRRKSQIIMSAKLDEIERTMAQLSPRILDSDLSLSFSSSEKASPTSPGFLSPRIQSDHKSFLTSSPPRLGFGRHEGEEPGKSWPAIPFAMIKEKEQLPENLNGLPPPPRLALNGVSTMLPRAAPTRPPPPPPLVGGLGMTMTETDKRRRELEEVQGVYEVTVRPTPEGVVIPLSPDPFGRYPSSSPNESPPEVNAVVPETRARSGTVTTTTKSRFSADSSDETAPPAPTGGLRPTSNRTTLISVKTIKKLWRRSKEKEKHGGGGGDAPPPTPVTPTFATFAASSDDIDKSLPSIPPPRPSRPSEERLELPDISMQASLPPRLSPSPTPRVLSRPSMLIKGDSAQTNMNESGRRTPLGQQELIPNGRMTPQEQLAVPPPSRPSLDQPPQRHTPPPQQQQQPLRSGSGRRTPQDQLMFPPPPSRPSLDQQPSVATLNQLPHPHPSGRRTPQDQLMFPLPPSRPALDQQPSVAASNQLSHTHTSGRRTPQDQLMFPSPPSQPSLDQQPFIAASNQLPHPHPHPSHLRHPSHPQQPMQIPMFQGRNPHNGPVTPLMAMHYPSRSASSASQQQKLDVNRLWFDQESPYPVRLAPSAGGGGGAATATATTTSTTKVAPAGYVASLPPPQPPRPPSVDPEKPSPTTLTTMRKSILKWKLANTNGNHDSSASSSSSSSTSSSIVGGGAVPRQSFERFERPSVAASSGHHARGGGGGRRPSVINFGSTSSLSSSTSISSNRGGTEIPRNPQVPVQYTTAASASSTGGESKRNHTPPNPHPQQTQTPSIPIPLALSFPNPKDLQPTSSSSLSPSRQSFDLQDQAYSPGSVTERRSNASSFDMTQFEFVSPVPASAPVHGSFRT